MADLAAQTVPSPSIYIDATSGKMGHSRLFGAISSGSVKDTVTTEAQYCWVDENEEPRCKLAEVEED